MAKTIKTCDLESNTAAKLFQMLNQKKVKLSVIGIMEENVIVTDEEPKNLVFPEGWYYAKGTFRNKYTSTSGIYSEIPMVKSNGESWGDIAKYCTKD